MPGRRKRTMSPIPALRCFCGWIASGNGRWAARKRHMVSDGSEAIWRGWEDMSDMCGSARAVRASDACSVFPGCFRMVANR